MEEVIKEALLRAVVAASRFGLEPSCSHRGGRFSAGDAQDTADVVLTPRKPPLGWGN